MGRKCCIGDRRPNAEHLAYWPYVQCATACLTSHFHGYYVGKSGFVERWRYGECHGRIWNVELGKVRGSGDVSPSAVQGRNPGREFESSEAEELENKLAIILKLMVTLRGFKVIQGHRRLKTEAACETVQNSNSLGRAIGSQCHFCDIVSP